MSLRSTMRRLAPAGLLSVAFAVGGAAVVISPVQALAGAHSYTNTTTGDVFLGGDYIELGISKLGSFGTTNGQPLPSGFFGTAARSNIGMSTNPTGFGVAPDLRMDYFMPGSPEERWAVGYKTGGTPHTASNSLLGGGSTITDNTVTDQSAGGKLQAEGNGTSNSTLKTTQVVSFNRGDKFFKNEVTLKNVSGAPIDSVRYMRSFDPDNTVDQDGEYETRINVPYTKQAGDDISLVVADTSLYPNDPVFLANGSRSPIFFYTSDSRARVSSFGFKNQDPYAAGAYDSAQAKGYTADADQAITVTFDVGTLAPGESQTVSYYTSLDNRDVSAVIDDIGTQEGRSPAAPKAGPNNGDGNGDGVDDETQPHVRHVPNAVAGSGRYVTLQIDGGCGTISSLAAKDAASFGKDGAYKYPLGMVDFSASCVSPGATSTIKLYYDELYDSSRWTARKFIGGTFVSVPGAVFGNAMVGGKKVTTLTYQVTDGGAMDDDGAVNGVIVDPAGPALIDGPTAPATGFKAMPLWPSLLAIAAGIVSLVGYAKTDGRWSIFRATGKP